MVAKFDDGKPVKPRDLYQRFNADSDSTLSEEDEDEEFYIEDDSFFEKHPLDDESDVLVEEKVEEVLNQTEKLFEEWQFTVKSVKPADGDFTEDKITTGKKVQTESILYAFFKISIYAVTLAFLISVVAEMTHDFNFNQAKESILYGFKNPSKASELLLKSAISKYDVIKARLQSFDFVVAQKQVQGSLISMVSSIKSRLESFELSHIKDSAVLMVGSAKARVDSIDYEFISNAFENVKSKVFENFEKSATFVRGIYMVEINARAHLFWDWISSGQIYEDINHSQVSLMNSAFVSASYQYLSQAKAAMSQFSLNFLRLLQAAYYMLSASFGKALTSIAELFDHPGFDESRRWINQIYSNFHNALEKQFSWILKSAMFKSGLLKFEDMIQSDDWNFLDSTGALLIAGGTTVGFIAFVLAFV